MTPSPKRKSVLLVDDDPDIQMLYTSQLEAAGLDVRSACDGISCLVAVRRERPDLVVLDLGLPAGDGESTLKNLRAKLDLKSLPILILSAREEAEWGDRLAILGASRYLQKPVAPAYLVAAVEELLGTPTVEAPAAVAPIPLPERAPVPAPNPAQPRVRTGTLGKLCCPHCGEAVAELNATLDPRALDRLAD